MTANDRVKFATYRRDSESSLDYAGNRYYDNVTGRFMTADPYGGSGVAGNPQSWNRYGYVLGDPVGGNDPAGLCSALLAGSTMNLTDPVFEGLQTNLGAVAGFPYSGLNLPMSVANVLSQATFGPNVFTQVALNTLQDAFSSNGGLIDVVAYSGGAQAFATALGELSPAYQARFGNILYISPGMVGTLPVGSVSATVVFGTEARTAAAFGTVIPSNVPIASTDRAHTDLGCLFASGGAQSALRRMRADGPCNLQDVFSLHASAPSAHSPLMYAPSSVTVNVLEIFQVIFRTAAPSPTLPPVCMGFGCPTGP